MIVDEPVLGDERYRTVMNHRERVNVALRRDTPDRVPVCELVISRRFAERLLGWPVPPRGPGSYEDAPFTADEAKAVAAALGHDNICFALNAPIYADRTVESDGRIAFGDGHIRTAADLALIDFPDPYDDALYAGAAAFAEQKGDYSAWFVTRVGIFSTWLSMGLENFAVALFEDLPLIERLLDVYVDWAAVVTERACRLGFDVVATLDDIAFKTAPFFSPQVFRDLVVPRYERIGKIVTLPWVMHSDGNVALFLDDIARVGVAGVHPMEKGAIDIRWVKQAYGDRLCVLGNVDMHMLSVGPVEAVENETRELLRDVAPGGGYILTSGNSIATYCQVEYVRAMCDAARTFGAYPIGT
jgi:uroporphyrinogen decarboxylase